MASYYVYSGAGGSANGTSWANAYTTLATAMTTKAAGDIFYVAHDHAEATANPTINASAGTNVNPYKVVCVNRAGSVPPVSADRRATATVSSTTNTNLTLVGCVFYDGIIFTAGAGSSSSANVIIGDTSGQWFRFDNCSLRLGITGLSASQIAFGGLGGTRGGIYTECNNTTFSFGSVNNAVSVVNFLKWRNTPSALLGVAVPSPLFIPFTVQGSSVECIGVDLSAMGSGKTIVNAGGNTQGSTYTFIDCKLDAAVTKSSVQSVSGGPDVDFIRSGAAGVNYTIHRQRMGALLTEETTIVRTGGASDGTTALAWKVVTTTNISYSTYFECPPIAIWNDTVGSAVTATVEGVWGGGSVPNDDDIWLDVEYLSSSSSPQGAFVNDGKADLLATAAGQTSSSATWGGSTTKFKLNVSFTPQQKGWVYARVKCAKASSTFYIDPLVTLT